MAVLVLIIENYPIAALPVAVCAFLGWRILLCSKPPHEAAILRRVPLTIVVMCSYLVGWWGAVSIGLLWLSGYCEPVNAGLWTLLGYCCAAWRFWEVSQIFRAREREKQARQVAEAAIKEDALRTQRALRARVSGLQEEPGDACR